MNSWTTFLRSITRRKDIWLAAGMAFLALAARLIPGPRTIDDAYITFRYARNILAGVGFVFNPGEHVLGTTTPLYTLAMVLLGALSGGVTAPFPVLALGLNSLADAVTCILLWKIGEQLKHPLAGFVAGLVWAVAPYSVTFAIGGMETSVYVLIITAVTWFYLQGRVRLAFFSAGLAFLTRPDALILIGLFGLDQLWLAIRKHSVRDLVSACLVFMVTVLPWLIFAWIYFGSPLPHSIAAKTLAYHLQPEEGLIRLIQHYATPFMDQMTLGTPAIGIGMVLYPFLAIVGIRELLRNNLRAWAALIFPWVYFAVFAAVNPLLFRWYLTSPLPAYFLGILVGAEVILTGVGKWLSARPGITGKSTRQGIAARAPFGLMVIPIILTLGGWVLHPDHGSANPAPDMAWIKLELLYSRAADFLKPQLKPGDVLAAGDVGVLGFQTGAKILDTVGLNSPESTRYYPLPPSQIVTNYAIPAALILDYSPKFVVFPEVYGRNTLLQSPAFQSQYQLIDTLESDIYGSRGILIFSRLPS